VQVGAREGQELPKEEQRAAQEAENQSVFHGVTN
jgi:hypothetical protein